MNEPIVSEAPVEAMVEAPEAVSQESMQAAVDSAIAQYILRTKYLTELGAKLELWKDEAARWRLQFESRWAKSIRQFNDGLVDTIADAKDNNQSTASEEPRYRASPDNVTRTVCLQIIARRQDSLFGDTNWGLKPSPKATLPPNAQALVAEARQNNASPDEIASIIQQEARRRCTRMTKIVADRLEESRYSKHGRRAIEDQVKLGTGVLEGPFPQVVTRRIWDGQQVQTVHDIVQRIEHVDLPCFFPQPCRHIEEAEHAFRLHIMTPTQVMALADQPGFDPDQVNLLLGKVPSLGALTANVTATANGNLVNESLKGRYPVFKYKGPVPRECLAYFGFAIPEEDKTTQFMGEVWFSMGVVIKATLAADDWATRLPFYVVVYERDSEALFGYSAPNVIETDQDSANVAWAAAKLNAMAAAVPIPGMVKQYMDREDGDYNLASPKPWIMKGVDDIRKALSFQTVPSVSDNALRIWELSKGNARERLQMPESVSGPAATGTPQTASGIAMVMNAGNIIQRYAANHWDDEVTIPMITAMVNYEMAYGEDMDAKGDYDPVPVASTQLIVKDVRMQQSLALLQLAETNQTVRLRIKEEVIVDSLLRDMDINVDEALRTDAEVAAMQEQQGQQPDPETTKANAALQRQQMESETRIMEAQAANDREMMKTQGNIEVAKLNLQAELARLAGTNEIKYAEIARDLRIAEGDQEVTRQMAAMRASIQQRNQDLNAGMQKFKTGMHVAVESAKLEDRRESRNLQVEVESPNPRLQ